MFDNNVLNDNLIDFKILIRDKSFANYTNFIRQKIAGPKI